MIDFELQVIDVAKATGATAQQSDADVASLKARGADLVGGPRADAGLVRAHGLDEFREAGDFGGIGNATPIDEAGSHRGFSDRQTPERLQLLLERIELVEGLVLREQKVKSLLIRGAQFVAIAQQQVEAALEHLLSVEVTQASWPI